MRSEVFDSSRKFKMYYSSSLIYTVATLATGALAQSDPITGPGMVQTGVSDFNISTSTMKTRLFSTT